MAVSKDVKLWSSVDSVSLTTTLVSSLSGSEDVESLVELEFRLLMQPTFVVCCLDALLPGILTWTLNRFRLMLDSAATQYKQIAHNCGALIKLLAVKSRFLQSLITLSNDTIQRFDSYYLNYVLYIKR